MDVFYDRTVVLEKRKTGEDTVEVLFLGESRGKFWAKAPAAAKSRKRFPAGIEHYILYEVELTQTSRQKKHGTLTLRLARPLITYSLMRDMAHYSLAARFTEVADRMLPMPGARLEGEQALEYQNVFNLIATAYATLESVPPEEVEIVRVWVEWRLLMLMGYALDPFRCPECDKPFSAEHPAWWSEARQGFFCKGCGGGETAACHELPSGALALAQKLVYIPLPKSVSAVVPLPKTDKADTAELVRMLYAQFGHVLPGPLKSDSYFLQERQP